MTLQNQPSITNIQLQRRLAQYPPDWPITIELDAPDRDLSATLQESNFFVDQSFDLDEIIIHNDPTYNQ